MKRLPLEVIRNIFDHVDQESLYKCLYICKSWHPLLMSIYFKEVHWRSVTKFRWLKSKLSTMDDNSVSLFKPLPMIKRLNISCDFDFETANTNSSSTRFTNQQLLYLLSLLPNLNYFNIVNSVHRDHYVKILFNCSERERLPPHIGEIAIENEDTRIRNQDVSMMSFAVYYKYRHSLQTMDINYIEYLANGSKFLETLPEYDRLTTLDICNYSDPKLTLFLLLQACPHLSSLTYSSTFPITVNAAQQLTDMMNKSRKSISQCHKNLSKVKLSIPALTTPYIDFFSNHSPKSLNSVELNLTKSNLYSWIDSMSLAVVINFCSSLKRFSHVKLGFKKTEHSVLQGPDTEINIFYRILHTLTKGRKISGHKATYNYKFGDDMHIEVCNDSDAIYHYCFDKNECMVRLPSYNAHDYHQNYMLPITSSTDQLAMIEDFILNIKSTDFYLHLSNYLEFAKNHCPRLKRFEIFNGWRYCFRASCTVSFDSSLENMTHVHLVGAQYSQQLFCTLAEYFPRMETMFFQIALPMSLDQLNEKKMFGLSNFKNLHTFIIEAESMWNLMEDFVSLQLNYAGSKEVVQYDINKKSEKQDAEEMQRTHFIQVEGLPQLKKIELFDCGMPFASLDLSHKSFVLIEE